MKANQALIAWTPGKGVRVEDITEDAAPWEDAYTHKGGAAYIATRHLTGDAGLLQMFIDFHKLVVRDGIAPKKAHDAFMAIDEYREFVENES